MHYKLTKTVLYIILAVSVLIFGWQQGHKSASNYYCAELIKVKSKLHETQIAVTVHKIMMDYNCTNKIIFDTIMEQFDPVLVVMVVAIESGYKIDAISRKNCRGLMQLSPDKLADWKNPRKNIQIGARYLEEQIIRFGSVELGIAAYNAGPGSIIKYNGVPPYEETKRYLKKLRFMQKKYQITD